MSSVPTRRVLLIASAADGFHRRVLGGVGRYAARAAGWTFRNYGLRDEDHLATTVIRDWRPTGIVSLAPTWIGPLALARSHGIPIVQGQELAADGPAAGASARPPPAVPRLTLDVRAVAAMAADYFAGRGLRSIAFVGGGDPGVGRQERAFRAAAAARRLAYAVFVGEPRPEVSATPGQFREWAAELPRPTGVLAHGDWLAAHVVGECLAAGLRVPDDLAVMGIGDDQPWCGLAPIPLTSVAVAADAIGYRAAGLLDRLMRGERVPAAPVLVAPAGVVSRRSTDVFAADEPDVADALRYIHDHACRPTCTVGAVARAAAIDRRRLERWCRRHLGRSPMAEIHRARMARARWLLAESDGRVADVARACGFASAATFSRAFHRQVGRTVVAYRDQFRRTTAAAADDDDSCG